MREHGNPPFAIAIVDDEEYVLDSVETTLRAEGYDNIAAIRDPATLLGAIEERGIGVVLLDISMPVAGGMELLPHLAQEHPGVSVAMMTGNRELERAVECMRLGAKDYLVKPVDRARLVATVRRLVDIGELERENVALRDRLLAPPGGRPEAFAGIVTGSAALDPIMRYVEAIAPTSHPVLVTGETGVGKELFARAVHDLSGRRGSFVPVNVAGLDDAFFSDLLFGHRAGAYTGASGTLDGLVDRARDGTLFLDEIGDLSRPSQVKLLRVIESGEYYPLGSDSLKRSKARIVVATNRDLAAAIKSGEFRLDLYYRLHSHHVHIPPLRERLGDLWRLVEHFVGKAAEELGKDAPALSPGVCDAFRGHDFPGNVRELEAIVFEAVSRHRAGPLAIESLAKAEGPAAAPSRSEGPATDGPSGILFPEELPTLAEMTELLVDEALRRSDGNQTATAKLLGISPQAVSKRMKGRRGN